MAWEEIVDFTVPSNTTSVTLNNFGTITKDDFIKIHTTTVNPSSGDNTIGLLANNSITSNYHRQTLQGFGSSIGAGRNQQMLHDFVFGNVASNTFAYAKLSENDRWNIFSNSFITNTSDLRTHFSYSTSSGATFTNGITSINFQGSKSNGLGAGSRIQIYRLTAEKVADITVTSNTTQVNITGLDIKKGDEYLLVSDNEGQNQGLRLMINNNTTTSNYYAQRIGGQASSAFASRNNEPFYISNGIGYTHVKLSNIGAFTYQSYTNRYLPNDIPNTFLLENWFGSSTAENIITINTLNIVSNSTNSILSGSRFQLYKLYEGGN